MITCCVFRLGDVLRRSLGAHYNLKRDAHVGFEINAKHVSFKVIIAANGQKEYFPMAEIGWTWNGILASRTQRNKETWYWYIEFGSMKTISVPRSSSTIRSLISWQSLQHTVPWGRQLIYPDQLTSREWEKIKSDYVLWVGTKPQQFFERPRIIGITSAMILNFFNGWYQIHCYNEGIMSSSSNRVMTSLLTVLLVPMNMAIRRELGRTVPRSQCHSQAESSGNSCGTAREAGKTASRIAAKIYLLCMMRSWEV